MQASSQIVTQVREWIRLSLNRPSDTIFRAIEDRIEMDVQRTVHGFHEGKKRTTKQKGDYMEALCYVYQVATQPEGTKVYFLRDVPEELRARLNLPKPDLGIDLVIIRPDQGSSLDPKIRGGPERPPQVIAVQCKYRVRGKKKQFKKATPLPLHVAGARYVPVASRGTTIKYEDLSTFIALCAKTGPWDYTMIMTNCDGASWKGLKTDRDITIARKTFEHLGLDTWIRMSGSSGHSLQELPLPAPSGSVPEKPPSRLKIVSERKDEGKIHIPPSSEAVLGTPSEQESKRKIVHAPSSPGALLGTPSEQESKRKIVHAPSSPGALLVTSSEQESKRKMVHVSPSPSTLLGTPNPPGVRVICAGASIPLPVRPSQQQLRERNAAIFEKKIAAQKKQGLSAISTE